MKTFSFRPLSRQIGSYTCNPTGRMLVEPEFPAPLEVDRYLYQLLALVRFAWVKNGFRPLSRLIGIYTKESNEEEQGYLRFRPLSRQIGIYIRFNLGNFNGWYQVSGPSRGRQVSIQKKLKMYYWSLRKSFRPLSRQIGNYTPYLVCKPITSTRYNLFKTTTSISYFVRVFISEYQINHIFFSS